MHQNGFLLSIAIAIAIAVEFLYRFLFYLIYVKWYLAALFLHGMYDTD